MTCHENLRSSGYICIALPGKRLEELKIPMMVEENQDPRRTAYGVTVDYKHGTSLIPFIRLRSFSTSRACSTVSSSCVYLSTQRPPAKLRDNYRHFSA